MYVPRGFVFSASPAAARAAALAVAAEAAWSCTNSKCTNSNCSGSSLDATGNSAKDARNSTGAAWTGCERAYMALREVVCGGDWVVDGVNGAPYELPTSYDGVWTLPKVKGWSRAVSDDEKGFSAAITRGLWV